MPTEPFRFVHAAHLRLDQPLAGTGPLDRDARTVAEDAALTALNNVVEGCLHHGVEFLLLTGETFGGRPTLRARKALLRAFEALHEFEIQVFWTIQREELAAVFDAFATIPDNVTPIHRGDGEPVAVVRQGRVIASVSSVGIEETIHRAGAGQTEHNERGALRIGVVDHVGRVSLSDMSDELRIQSLPAIPDAGTSDYDYLALCGHGKRWICRRERDVAHNPGSTQGIDRGEIGLHGATLVSVSAERDIRLDLLPTAPVRWERIRIGIEAESSREQLVDCMESALLELESTPVEQIWIVNWQLIGCSGFSGSLPFCRPEDGFLDVVDRRTTFGSGIRRFDRVQFRQRRGQHDDEPAGQISEWIERDGVVEEALRELGTLSGPDWFSAVHESLADVPVNTTREIAQRMSRELLQNGAGIETPRDREAR